jgi:hypothetical protein
MCHTVPLLRMNQKQRPSPSPRPNGPATALRDVARPIALGALSLALQALFGLPLPIAMPILIVRTKIVLKR